MRWNVSNLEQQSRERGHRFALIPSILHMWLAWLTLSKDLPHNFMSTSNFFTTTQAMHSLLPCVNCPIEEQKFQTQLSQSQTSYSHHHTNTTQPPNFHEISQFVEAPDRDSFAWVGGLAWPGLLSYRYRSSALGEK